MCRILSEFDQLLVECFKEGRFPCMDRGDFNTLLLTNNTLYSSKTGERVFAFVCKFTDNMVEILFRPGDSNMIDDESLDDALNDSYADGDCVGYDTTEMDDGRVFIFFNPKCHTFNDQLELIRIFKESIDGEARMPNYYDGFRGGYYE